jgi:hypothetical protein
MISSIIIIGAILPLYGLLFHTALLTQLGQWVLLPAHLLFPGWPLTPSLVNGSDSPPPPIALGWQHVFLLLGGFVLILICYLFALRSLPERIGRRYILISTLLIGSVCVLVPVVTSQDIFSYIIYARMAIIYQLNPLTTLPGAIHADPVFQHLYWKDQPSAYGPTWIYITGFLQQVTGDSVVGMILALRLLSLGAHLWSTLLIWSIGGRLQRQKRGIISKRALTQATLAFAWNPLLLFEACVNAHNDAVLLLFVLIAIWFLVTQTPGAPWRTSIVNGGRFFARSLLPTTRCIMLTAFMLALATCLKVNIVLLFPGLLLFLWTKPRRMCMISVALVVYGGTILLLYAPFWQDGALLNILHINPGTYRDINNLPEFLSHFYNSVAHLLGAPLAPDIGSPSEMFVHTLSICAFVIIYALSCGLALGIEEAGSLKLPGEPLSTPLQLIRWMTLIWLLYCAFGTPWTWPWYAVTFFGLFALLEAVDNEKWSEHPYLSMLRLPGSVRLLAFSMLSLYCFYTWAPFASFVPWLPGFRWAYWRGLWVWLLPCLVMLPFVKKRTHAEEENEAGQKRR